jgi:hypothetical protein
MLPEDRRRNPAPSGVGGCQEIEIVSNNADGPALQVRENAWVDAYRRTPRTKPVGLESDVHFLL